MMVESSGIVQHEALISQEIELASTIHDALDKLQLKQPQLYDILYPMKEMKAKRPMDLALRYLSARARTVRELEYYLDEKQFDEVVVQETVDRLVELGLLDDANYALEFVQSRLRSKPISRATLQRQLAEHFVPREHIESALDFVTPELEQENCLAVLRKYWRQLERLPQEERKARVTQRALSRGFSYADIAWGFARLEV